MCGPTPAGLSPDEWREVRARFLSEEYEQELEDCKNDLLRQEATLQSFVEHDETILWFEHDLFCQINLIYLLEWFSKQSLEKTRLSLICIGEFPGVRDFRGLGQLTGEQLALLFDGRYQVTEQLLSVANRAWTAYGSANPEAIELLLEEDTSAMPFLATALRAHLARFPSVTNGLGRIESKALELISEGGTDFKTLFVKFAAAEPVYGLGDAQLWCELKRLAKGKEPLIKVSGIADGKRFHDASFELTEKGKSVLLKLPER
jgi:hypothetical protein